MRASFVSVELMLRLNLLPLHKDFSECPGCHNSNRLHRNRQTQLEQKPVGQDKSSLLTCTSPLPLSAAVRTAINALSHSQGLLRKRSDLLLLSPDITPSSRAFPESSRKHPWVCCPNFCGRVCAPDQAPSQQNQTLHSCYYHSHAKWKNWNFSIWFSLLHLKKEHILPLGHSDRLTTDCPFKFEWVIHWSCSLLPE